MGFAINTRDGRISVWVEGVSNCCYHPIPDDIAHGVSDGSIRWEDVVNAINKKRYQDKDFDWTALRASEEQLNVRTAKFEFADEGKGAEKSDEKEVKNAITMDDVVSSAGEDAAAVANAVEGKKSTSRRKREPKVETPDIFDDGAPEVAQ